MQNVDHKKKVESYFATRESRWGYKYLLKGTKHYGYYPVGGHLSMHEAQREMERQLGRKLDLAPGAKILDAGCGEGFMALHLAQEFGYEIYGIDLLDWSIKNANKNRLKAVGNRLHFAIGDYENIQFPNNTFDGVYTMETLMHASDYKKALKEIHRVLKPGGITVNFEYALDDNIPTSDAAMWETIYRNGALINTYKDFRINRMKSIWREAGFINVELQDITPRMERFMKRLHDIALVPYYLMRLMGQAETHVNAYAGVRSYRQRHQFH